MRGQCNSVYNEQIITRGETMEVGEVMCDEMEQKEDRKAVGFTADFICKKQIMKSFLDKKEIASFHKPATYVNQWRYSSVNGCSFNCEFWYNSGNLSGNGLLEKFNSVVMSCEAVGSAVLGFVCNAGGSNARLMKMLRGNTILPEQAWLLEEYTQTRNPFDPNHFI